MSEKTGIEWTDATWNPVTGCTKISPGCAHCYIERTPPFRMNHRRFNGKGTTGVQLHPERLNIPFRWRKPRRVFVNSLSDLFHDAVPTEFILKVFETMAFAKNHIFQVLTKRPQRMKHLLAYGPKMLCDSPEHHRLLCTMPLPNVWLGVSVENQHFADERIPLLLDTPAAIRFISAEPLLEPIELPEAAYKCPGNEPHAQCPCLDWVIVGAESGPGARDCDYEWVYELVDQCQEVCLPIFVKQLCKNGIKIPYDSWPEPLQVREWPE
jgi:protein gp37